MCSDWRAKNPLLSGVTKIDILVAILKEQVDGVASLKIKLYIKLFVYEKIYHGHLIF